MNLKEMGREVKNFLMKVEINTMISPRKDTVVYRVFKNEDDKIGKFIGYSQYLDPTASNIIAEAKEKLFDDNYKIQLIIVDRETNKQKGIFLIKG